MNLQALREETREEHEATEALLPLTAPGLDRELYGRLLQCFYTMLQGWETWASGHAPPPLLDTFEQRRRTPLLRDDLRFLGLPTGEGAGTEALQAVLAGKEPGAAEYEAAFLGSMYVIEGSTLGGQYIARHVEKVLGLYPGQGDAYFRGYGEQTGAMWNGFRELLRAVPEEHASAVVAAAKATFAYVQETMRPCSVSFPRASAPPSEQASGAA